ncbi:MAG TPA: nuclear transport factor 2 family protein [Sphingobium sp.]|uniref:nuclear transport factor 2 family protein n=1 Tax=Sphingobium sp. TaxID=1912891 RepID=UPI002ED58A7D
MADQISDLERLAALAEIGLLKARRDRAADAKDWALYEALHASDHRSYNDDYGGTTTATEMMVVVKKSMENLTTMHQSHTPEIMFESPTQASGIWAMEGLSIWTQGGAEHWFQAFGHYYETYEKRNGHWLFTSRRLKYYHTWRSPGAIFPPPIDGAAD